jgi:hypothetical protein
MSRDADRSATAWAQDLRQDRACVWNHTRDESGAGPAWWTWVCRRVVVVRPGVGGRSARHVPYAS